MVLLSLVAAPATTTKSAPKTSPAPKAGASKSHSKAKTASRTSHRGRHTKKASGKNWRHHGQQKIDAERAHEIQDALIKAHYLNGEATGEWDAATQKAMERYQADNGWQAKSVPDSRALIKLGLGPDHEHLLNPESAMTTAPVSAPSGGAKARPVETAPPENQPQK